MTRWPGKQSLAGIAPDPIPVSASKSDNDAGFEIVDGNPPKIKLPEDFAKAPTHNKQTTSKKKKDDLVHKYEARLPDRPWKIPPRFVAVAGAILFVGGFVSLMVDLFLSESHIHPYLLLVLGGIAAVIGYILETGAK